VIGDDPVRAVARLKKQRGDSLCVHTVYTGADARGARIMDEAARAGGCGFSVNAKDILPPGAMADFVKRALFVPTPYPDSDGDGVFDHLDKCPATPESAKIDAVGCPQDADGDGILDDKDQCPNTLNGARTNARGCWFLEGALFDSNDTALKPGAFDALDEVARILSGNPGVRVTFIGHTDSRGSATYNMRLSIKRANAAKAYMFKKGIDPARISTAGRGETRPRSSNDTEEGRAANRRIEIQTMK
jgi:OmpA-OmpF porin, OOP family